jgi:hypothetical protein
LARPVIDLRVKGKGCTGDPVYRLNNVLGKGFKEVELIVDPSKLPLAVVSLVAKRKGYSVVRHEVEGGSLRVTLIAGD